jgi:uncharacterized membrane protein HdeD (DUF308 family)
MSEFLKKWSRSPIWPVLLSALVAPGLGQVYNRDLKRGILLLAVSLGGFFWFSSILTNQLSVFLPSPPETWVQHPEMLKEAITKVVAQNPSMFVTFYALMIFTWLFAVVDAYLSSKKLRRLPPPPADEDLNSLS